MKQQRWDRSSVYFSSRMAMLAAPAPTVKRTRLTLRQDVDNNDDDDRMQRCKSKGTGRQTRPPRHRRFAAGGAKIPPVSR